MTDPSHDPESAVRDSFLAAFRGSFTSALRWHHLDALWERVYADADGGWFVYAVGEAPPKAPADQQRVRMFVTEIDRLLRQDHAEDYCGIVYADDLQQPRFIKIYDPNNLGVSCGYSTNPPLPGWLLTKLPPCDLNAARAAQNRRRWWQRLFNQ
jgi:hypothetical protein